jgi:hypothetical protein
MFLYCNHWAHSQTLKPFLYETTMIFLTDMVKVNAFEIVIFISLCYFSYYYRYIFIFNTTMVFGLIITGELPNLKFLERLDLTESSLVNYNFLQTVGKFTFLKSLVLPFSGLSGPISAPHGKIDFFFSICRILQFPIHYCMLNFF